MVGSDAAMRVKSRKPPAENFITSDCVTVSRSRGGADDVVGDQVRHVAGDGEHHVMVLGLHGLDIRAERRQKARDRRDRLGIGARRRRQDAPAVLEELGEARLGPGILGAGDGMRRHEMHARREMRRHLADDRLLHRPDIGDDRAGFRCGAICRGDVATSTDGHREDDEIGPFGGLGSARV